MKKIVILIVCLLLSSPALAGNLYIAVGGGAGGEAEAASISIDGGYLSSDWRLNFISGLGIGVIFNGEDTIPSDTLDYPCPHNDYTDLGLKRVGAELAYFGKGGVEIFKERRIFAFALAGASMSGEEIELSRSNVTGWLYTESSSHNTYGVFGGGLGYYKKLVIQIEYDNRRGVTGSIGYAF